ncbi:MAG: DUF4233 domain-containing protein [Intrasporangium sp.]|uniref:DUF4233 domain-containing protein n=1 Tax=Intrasporangium sp. TaxID=1925024 RepID=UPI0026471276|nr:DUF4233 domain-containing protein [Intrasporangium sp.]MDN5794219.1 DUF4233 domain-containing protein [Intrasporangium sp.]
MSRLVFYGRTGRFTWRMLATVLAGQSIIIFFGALVARGTAIAQGDPATAGRYLLVGSVIAALCLLGAGLTRKPYGVTLGWLVQVLTLLAGFVVPMMFLAGLIFLALWVTSLLKGGAVDRMQTPVG